MSGRLRDNAEAKRSSGSGLGRPGEHREPRRLQAGWICAVDLIWEIWEEAEVPQSVLGGPRSTLGRTEALRVAAQCEVCR